VCSSDLAEKDHLQEELDEGHQDQVFLQAVLLGLQEDLAEARQDRRMVLTRWHEAMHMNADLLAKLARLGGTR